MTKFVQQANGEFRVVEGLDRMEYALAVYGATPIKDLVDWADRLNNALIKEERLEHWVGVDLVRKAGMDKLVRDVLDLRAPNVGTKTLRQMTRLLLLWGEERGDSLLAELFVGPEWR